MAEAQINEEEFETFRAAMQSNSQPGSARHLVADRRIRSNQRDDINTN